MLERIEDAADVAWLKKARLKGTSYRPFSEYLKESKRVPGRHSVVTSENSANLENLVIP